MKRSQARSAEAIEFAKQQRATSNEFASIVWQWIRNRQCFNQKFRREFPIPPYTVDSCCVEQRLVIEVDGESHFSDEGIAHDRERDRFLSELGYRVMRISGYDVIRDGHAANARIEAFVAQHVNAPHPQPLSPERGEGSKI